MLELLNERRSELRHKYRKDMDIEIAYRLKEVELLIKRYKRILEAEIDAAGFREELTQLAKDMDTLQALGETTDS
jgi:hypothetical protein